MSLLLCPACGIGSGVGAVFTDPHTLNQECPNCGTWSHQDEWSETDGDGDGDPNDPNSYDIVQDQSGTIVQCNYCGSYQVGEAEFEEFPGVHLVCFDCNVILEPL